MWGWGGMLGCGWAGLGWADGANSSRARFGRNCEGGGGGGERWSPVGVASAWLACNGLENWGLGTFLCTYVCLDHM